MSTHAPTPAVGPPKAYRSSDARILGGVAAGLAAHLGVETLYVRVAFLLTAFLGGFGAVMYAGLWLILPTDAHLERRSPGLEAASRQGKRPGRARRLEDVGPLVAMGALALGLAVLARSFVGGSGLFSPVLARSLVGAWLLFGRGLRGVVGLAVRGGQADDAQRERWLDSSGRVDF